MFEAHPNREELEGFMLGDLAPEPTRRVLRHLLADCERCQEATALMWDVGASSTADRPLSAPSELAAAAAGRAPVGRFDYDWALDRVFDRVRRVNAALQAERSEAHELFAELLRHPHERRLILLQNSTRFQSWGLCELMLQKPGETVNLEPREAKELAELAVTLAESLSPVVYGPALVQDWKARAWACLGNANRVLSDFRSAEQCFQVAESHLARGTGDRLERARLLDLKASLRNYQGRTEEAISLLNRAIAIYQRSGQRHLLGRALLNKGHVTMWSGDLETSIALLRQGLALVDGERDAKLVVTSHHNLAYVLNELGQHREALAIVSRTRQLYLEVGDRLNLLRLEFLEGQIAMALGRLEQAEGIFREVRRSFGEKEMAYDAALATLDLAGVYARQGRSAEMQPLAQEMLPIFESRELHREAIAALIMFQQAAERNSVTLSLIQEVTGCLQRVRRHTAGEPAAF
ncbi:MAG TPA: tetratricopeptide repeat protein [Thermoanaerobaculia bacterium]|jgi:tetratricopeptide (TPR) repeat protein|nr:tetratricopeptide repeat protein [Thermoanaerobaculia bacterium]